MEIRFVGKAPGVTNAVLWEDGDIAAVYDLQVSYNVTPLKERLNDLFPKEEDIRVLATHQCITLAGTVSSERNASQVLAVASAFAPECEVRNLLNVAGVHQVMLEVRVAEMSRSLIRRLGVNFNWVRKSEFGISTLGGLTQLVEPDDANIASGGPFGIFVSPSVNALFRFNYNASSWTGFIDALKGDGLVKILAEPTLISLSGQEAKFLAGGEFPIPVPQGLGTVAIKYKPFGVGLSFTPTVLSEDKISIKVMPEVSELDFSTAVAFEGFVVPGLSTRKASTVVELGDGQSFAIAGLISENVRNTVSKWPLLGDIPILGALFRSSQFQKNETELVIVVTPHLVKPLEGEDQPLPTDYYIEPDDKEWYLWGMSEGIGSNKSGDVSGKMDGEFGHIMPVTK
jgi:pilus assembly protein CpaC